MAEHPNVTLVRRAIDALNSGDLATLLDTAVADDVVWHEIGGSEPIRGKEALRERMAGDPGFEIQGTAHDVVGNDEHVVALVNATATRGGRTLEYRTAEIFHIRDGRLTERWSFSDDTAAIEAFFA